MSSRPSILSSSTCTARAVLRHHVLWDTIGPAQGCTPSARVQLNMTAAARLKRASLVLLPAACPWRSSTCINDYFRLIEGRTSVAAGMHALRDVKNPAALAVSACTCLSSCVLCLPASPGKACCTDCEPLVRPACSCRYASSVSGASCVLVRADARGSCGTLAFAAGRTCLTAAVTAPALCSDMCDGCCDHMSKSSIERCFDYLDGVSTMILLACLCDTR